MVGDLMKDFRYSLDQVLGMGFYEAHRLWFISDEIRARELSNFSMALDFQEGKEDFRKQFLDWVKARQSYRSGTTSNIPKHVMDTLMEKFNAVRKRR